MSDEKCAVPNCHNPSTTGIPFPKQQELLEKWLQSLDIPDFTPGTGSFVCLEHFGEDDVLGHSTGSSLATDLEELPIPIRKTIQKCEVQEIKNEDEEEKIEDKQTMCRLCMSTQADINVFDLFEDVTISDFITRCIPSIKIRINDNMSKRICTKCSDILKMFFKFKKACLECDQKQREMAKQSQKRKQTSNASAASKKRLCSSDPTEQEFSIRSDVDKKFDHVEAELMRALEGKLTEEMKSADNIIIEVQSDDEHDENVVSLGADQIKLPKGIKVKVSHAKVGLLESKPVKMNSFEFCIVDDYLFEYGLCKENVRHLKCLASNCRSTAQQKMLEAGVFESQVLVKSAHNHQPPTGDERKKQMFLHLMRRKMQNDKTQIFKNVYEEFCAKDPEIRRLVPLRSVINQICCQQMNVKSPSIYSFEQFYDSIEDEEFQKLHFAHSNQQFYQEKLSGDDSSKAVIFANCETIEQTSDSKIMYVDASFKIDTSEHFKYHLVTILVWVVDSFYPILFALINKKSQEIYKLIFDYLHTTLAPKLRPREIVTDYEAALYYSLGEVYLDSHIGGSVFYYTQNLYKKICSLNLSRELETNSCFRNIYHMILMLPLLPVNTIVDGLTNIELQASEMGQADLTAPIFEYVKSQWIARVTPDLFCVHRLENRINENVIAPFKKLRDFLMLSKGKMHKHQINIVSVVEKLIELEGFLQSVYSAPSKKSFARDLSSFQKKNVIRAWHYIESHPKININNFFMKVLGYIKCMENQLWIWGFYRYTGDTNDELINAANFSIVNTSEDDDHNYDQNSSGYIEYIYPDGEVVMDVVINDKDGFLVKENEPNTQ